MALLLLRPVSLVMALSLITLAACQPAGSAPAAGAKKKPPASVEGMPVRTGEWQSGFATLGTLRANDLIWRYVVDSYLKGATPDAFDLLYWDSDSVSLPGPMYCWYTRNTYLENKIREPGKTTQCGEDIDLGVLHPDHKVVSGYVEREGMKVPFAMVLSDVDAVRTADESPAGPSQNP